ncbi:MAG: hypothetical protein JZD41_02605 [Thermoproteus sp.]|nr:hypothetical protein [Thermoproteus sp.]
MKLDEFFGNKKEVKEKKEENTAKKNNNIKSGGEERKQTSLRNVVEEAAKKFEEPISTLMLKIYDYMERYKSVGIIRLYEDVAKPLKLKMKVDDNDFKKALNVLREIGAVDVVDIGVVNWRGQFKNGES